MTNAEKFKINFGLYATELWAMSEESFLSWLNSAYEKREEGKKENTTERKTGKWIDGMPYVNSHWKVCSVCHQTAPFSCGGEKFCPNCGADMRGE